MKQVQTNTCFLISPRKKGLSVAVLALYPQSSTLTLAIGRKAKFGTTQIALDVCHTQLIKEDILPWLEAQGAADSLQLVVSSGFMPLAEEDGLYSLPSLPKQSQGPIALVEALARELRLPAYLIDPATPQECLPNAPITGTPEFSRVCYGDNFIFKFLSRQEGPGKFVAAHLDETVQIAALMDERILDLSTSAHEGPFALGQAGGLPFDSVLDLCAAADSREQLQEKINSAGGFKGFYGEIDFVDLVKDETLLGLRGNNGIWQAFIYQVAKEIAAYATVLEGSVDAILLSGELVRNSAFLTALRERIAFLARRISLFPGNQGPKALLAGAERILAGERILDYQ